MLVTLFEEFRLSEADPAWLPTSVTSDSVLYMPWYSKEEPYSKVAKVEAVYVADRLEKVDLAFSENNLLSIVDEDVAVAAIFSGVELTF